MLLSCWGRRLVTWDTARSQELEHADGWPDRELKDNRLEVALPGGEAACPMPRVVEAGHADAVGPIGVRFHLFKVHQGAQGEQRAMMMRD